MDMSLRVTESCSISFSPTMTAYLALADDANLSALAIFLPMMSMSAETPDALNVAVTSAAFTLMPSVTGTT